MKKIKITDIAKHFNLSHAAISSWFSGRTVPNIKQALILKEKFGLPLKAWEDIESYLLNSRRFNTRKKACKKANED